MNKILFFIFIFIFIFIVYVSSKEYEYFSNGNGKIPSIMYKTGPENIPSEKILKLFRENERKLNVKTSYFNDQDCLNFMRKIGGKYLQAYNSLIPNAYKADLWRYTILYHKGGVYGDLTQLFLQNYDINRGNVDMVLVKDKKKNYIQNSFIATVKGNGFLKYLIESICENILKKNLGNNSLDITGPSACGRIFLKFFNRDNIPYGINILKGLDNKYYKIKIDIQQYPNSFYSVNGNGKIAITKASWHNNMITQKGKQDKYWILYQQNKVFK